MMKFKKEFCRFCEKNKNFVPLFQIFIVHHSWNSIALGAAPGWE